MKKLPFLVSTMALALIADPARAAVTIDFVQGSTGVTINVSGSLNTSTLVHQGNYSLSPNDLRPSAGVIAISNSALDIYRYSNGSPFTFGPFLPGSQPSVATYSSGSFGIVANSYLSNAILLPTGYVSGSALSASAFFSGSTFSSLGITPTDQSYALGGGESVNLAFSTVAAPGVPEPATWAMMILGMGAVGLAMRRRRQQPRVRYDFA